MSIIFIPHFPVCAIVYSLYYYAVELDRSVGYNADIADLSNSCLMLVLVSTTRLSTKLM